MLFRSHLITFYYFWITSIPNIGYAKRDRKERRNINKMIVFDLNRILEDSGSVVTCAHAHGFSQYIIHQSS